MALSLKAFLPLGAELVMIKKRLSFSLLFFFLLTTLSAFGGQQELTFEVEGMD